MMKKAAIQQGAQGNAPILTAVQGCIGNFILHVAEKYANPYVLLREWAQNAFDKNARHMFIAIDAARGSIIAYDDGDGASPEEVTERFQRICISSKRGNPEMSGEHGIGNLAAIALGEHYELVTRARGTATPLVSHKLRKADLPDNWSPSLRSETWGGSAFPSKNGFQPTTMVRVQGMNAQAMRPLRSCEGLEDEILNTLGAKLKRLGMIITVRYTDSSRTPARHRERVVKPRDFRGQPLDAYKIKTEKGEIVLRLFCSGEKVSSPKILIDHKGKMGIPLRNLVLRHQLDQAVYAVWDRGGKGYIEGCIELPFCAQNGAHDAFVFDDDLSVFITALEGFTKDILKPLVEEFESGERSEKYQRVTDEVRRRLRARWKENPDLVPDELKPFIVVEETGGGGKKVQTPKGLKKPRVIRPDVLVRPPAKKGDPNPKKPPQGDDVSGVSGKKLAEKVGTSIDIRIEAPRPEMGFGWRSSTPLAGVIWVNSAHSDFRTAETLGSTKLTEYVSVLVAKELACLSLSEVARREFDRTFEKTYFPLWAMNLHS